MKVANKVFERVAMADVSTSAEEAREKTFSITLMALVSIRITLLYDAKQKVLALSKLDIKHLSVRKSQSLVIQAMQRSYWGLRHVQFGGYVSEHDVKIAEKLAYVLSGGALNGK